MIFLYKTLLAWESQVNLQENEKIWPTTNKPITGSTPSWVLRYPSDLRPLEEGALLVIQNIASMLACFRVEGLGQWVQYVSGRKRPVGEMNGKSGNLNSCTAQLYPRGCLVPSSELICVLDADQVWHTPRPCSFTSPLNRVDLNTQNTMTASFTWFLSEGHSEDSMPFDHDVGDLW